LGMVDRESDRGAAGPSGGGSRGLPEGRASGRDSPALSPDSVFDKFRIGRFRLKLGALERISLPRYKGSAFRGAFGAVFRRVVCAQPDLECGDCLLKPSCPYSYVFETSPPRNSRMLKKYNSVPRPFILEPPDDRCDGYEAGQTFDVGLVLLGRALDMLPYFVLVFKELGHVGIGRRIDGTRGKFALEEISAVNDITGSSRVVYRPGNNSVGPLEPSVTPHELTEATCRLPERSIAVRFLTMTRLKYSRQLTDVPHFHIIIRNLLRRASTIAYFHHGNMLHWDFRGLVRKAQDVRLTQNRTRWVDWERFSRRQSTRMKLGGIVGEAVYEGPLKPFLPLLVLGRYVHVGKNVTFGLGKYELIPPAGA